MEAQIFYLIMLVMGFGIVCHRHGKPKEMQDVNVWVWLIQRVLIAVVLYWGGWFDCFLT